METDKPKKRSGTASAASKKKKAGPASGQQAAEKATSGTDVLVTVYLLIAAIDILLQEALTKERARRNF